MHNVDRSQVEMWLHTAFTSVREQFNRWAESPEICFWPDPRPIQALNMEDQNQNNDPNQYAPPRTPYNVTLEEAHIGEDNPFLRAVQEFATQPVNWTTTTTHHTFDTATADFQELLNTYQMNDRVNQEVLRRLQAEAAERQRGIEMNAPTWQYFRQDELAPMPEVVDQRMARNRTRDQIELEARQAQATLRGWPRPLVDGQTFPDIVINTEGAIPYAPPEAGEPVQTDQEKARSQRFLDRWMDG